MMEPMADATALSPLPALGITPEQLDEAHSNVQRCRLAAETLYGERSELAQALLEMEYGFAKAVEAFNVVRREMGARG